MSSSKAADTEALVRKWATLFSESKFEELIPLGAPKATWWNSGLKEQNPMAGTVDYEQRIRGVMASPLASSLKVEVVNVVVDASGEKAVVEIVAKTPADSPVAYSNDIVVIFSVKEGKVEWAREYMDFYPVQKFMKEMEAINPK